MKGISVLILVAGAFGLAGCASSTASIENQSPAANPPLDVAAGSGPLGGAFDLAYTGVQAITDPGAFSGSGEPAKKTYPPDP